MRNFTSNLFFNKWLFLLVCMITSAGIFAQARMVTGKIATPDNEPLIGATVLVNGSTNRGTVTDFNGTFSIEVQDGETLTISYTGYTPRSIVLGSESSVNIILEPGTVLLEQMVVVGYGQSRKSDLTGAISSVSGEQMRGTMTANLDQALQGRVAGVQVTQNTGQPGGVASIRIRGANSITGSSEPLYVIDGIPIQGDGSDQAGFDWAGGENGQNKVNPLASINPADVVSVEVLKDASASAIFGSRAANGVILITTKRGKKGEAKISYNGYYGNQSLANELDMMTLPQFADYQTQISGDLFLAPNQRYLDPTLLGDGTNWQQEIFRDAAMQSHQLSISGGTDKTTFALSGGYFDQDGIVIGSKFDRYTTRLNMDSQVKDWFKIGGSLSYGSTREKITLNDGGDGVIMEALLIQPDIPVKDFNGDYAGPEVTYGATNYNPVASALQRNNTVNRQRIMSSVYGDVNLFKGLTFRSEIGLDNNHTLNQAFHPTYKWGVLVNTENQLRQREENSFFWIWKNYLTYNFNLGEKNQFTALAGTEAQKASWEGSQVTKKNFASNDIHVLSEGDDATSTTFGWKDASTIASYFGRLNYTFDEKYLLTVTMRADGASKFGPNNRWGYFPSGSVAWRIGEEGFMDNMNALSNLKLRIGYGEVGNQAIPTYLYGSSLLTVNTPFGTGYRLEKISNPNLKWESTKQFNVGLDFGLFNGRVDVTADVYTKKTDGMLLQLSVPGYLGGSNFNDIKAPFANVGSMENKGFELSIFSRNISSNKFRWGTDLIFSLNRNKITALDDDSRIYYRNLYWYSEFQTATQTRVGEPLGQFYGYVTEGIFQNQQDIMDHAIQNSNGELLIDKQAGIWIGDVKFKDLNNDGVINTLDQTVIGDPNPDFTFGLNNTFSLGSFDLGIYLTGSYGADILNYSRVLIEGQTSVYNNQASSVNDRARFGYTDPNGSTIDPANVFISNPDATIPRPTTTDNNRNNRMSDRFIEDGSYLRIQNIKLGYSLPPLVIRKMKMENLKVYINAQNIFTFTKYSGYDPEIGAFDQDPLLQNVDIGRYPSPRVITFGMDVDF
ncbi:MAG TPA: TonB-dependent receptor [Saprospiraceae bacterium]|nr:TonB-dependent receptor [Saprospiraceae bacterium]